MNKLKSKTPALVAAIFFGICCIRVSSADLSASYAWKPMKIGGGGWVTGMDISPTEKGLMYVRTDVSGAYRWDASTALWKQLVHSSSMPAESSVYGRYAGVDSLVGAPKDPDVAYMAFAGKPYGEADGQIFRSTNRGDTWTPTNFAAHKVKMEPNGSGRQEGERLAVDPATSDIVFYGSIADGLWLTRDGGVTWSKIQQIPSGTPAHGVTTVVFDKKSGATKAGEGTAKTGTIYVTVEEAGIFKTDDGGAAWVRISDSGPGSSGKPRDAEIGPDGTYYVVFDNEKDAKGSAWKYACDGTWTDITPPLPEGGSVSYWDLAADPSDSQRLVVMRNGGKCFVSNDQGANWTAHGFGLKSQNIQWQGTQNNYYLSTGEILFDPFEPGKLWFAEGFGVWWAGDLTTPNIEWHSASEGIEEMCGNDVIAPPGGRPVAAMWDVGAFCFTDPDAYTAVRSHPGFMSCWALDWCPAAPGFLAAVFRSHLDFVPKANSSGYSTDGGKTWVRFPALENGTLPKELEYGVIAVSANSKDKIVWSPARTKLPYHTTDCGATWNQSSFGGISVTGFDAHYTPQKPLCADRVLPDTFYFYLPQEGIYLSTDAGSNFIKVGNPVSNRHNIILKSAPGHAGHLWFAEGTIGGLWHSADGGSTWASVPGLQQAFNVGLGKPQSTDDYPTLFVAGVADGKTGIFRSTDKGQTWDTICIFPLGIFDWIDAMDGDKDVFGKIYIGFAGAGFAYGTPSDP